MTIPEMIARCRCSASGEPDPPDCRERPMRSLDGEPISGFQEVRFDRLDHEEAVVARATAWRR